MQTSSPTTGLCLTYSAIQVRTTQQHSYTISFSIIITSQGHFSRSTMKQVCYRLRQDMDQTVLTTSCSCSIVSLSSWVYRPPPVLIAMSVVWVVFHVSLQVYNGAEARERNSTVTITFNLMDVNDETPYFTVSPPSVCVNESAPAGHVVSVYTCYTRPIIGIYIHTQCIAIVPNHTSQYHLVAYMYY